MIKPHLDPENETTRQSSSIVQRRDIGSVDAGYTSLLDIALKEFASRDPSSAFNTDLMPLLDGLEEAIARYCRQHTVRHPIVSKKGITHCRRIQYYTWIC